jgi:hypothetical protein
MKREGDSTEEIARAQPTREHRFRLDERRGQAHHYQGVSILRPTFPRCQKGCEILYLATQA